MNQPRIASVRFLAGVLAVCSVTGIAYFGSSAHAQPAPVAPAAVPAPKVGVINFHDVYVKMKETNASNMTITGLQGELETKVGAHKKQIELLQQQILSGTKAGSKERDQKMDEMDQEILKDSTEEQTLKLGMARAQARQLKTAYDEIKQACTDIAKKKGLDVVIVSNGDLPDNISEGNPEQIGNAIFSRNVMYVSDAADISSQVLLAVDAAYTAKGGH